MGLLVIDAQVSFPTRPYWQAEGMPAFLTATNRLIDGFAAAGLPIVRVLHEDGAAHADNPFSTLSGLVRLLDGLREFTPSLDVLKHHHSAPHQRRRLDGGLRARRPPHLRHDHPSR